MEEVLEIRDGCTTPTQLLKSKAFAQYLEIYKKSQCQLQGFVFQQERETFFFPYLN